jgi:hypothetical protein
VTDHDLLGNIAPSSAASSLYLLYFTSYQLSYFYLRFRFIMLSYLRSSQDRIEAQAKVSEIDFR